MKYPYTLFSAARRIPRPSYSVVRYHHQPKDESPVSIVAAIAALGCLGGFGFTVYAAIDIQLISARNQKIRDENKRAGETNRPSHGPK